MTTSSAAVTSAGTTTAIAGTAQQASAAENRCGVAAPNTRHRA
ncbi:hypothetical protein AB0C04_31575 [Micromonospora sp. NPDC048909]